MIITKTQIDVKILYEHRHLLSDDRIYNSLVISNLINKNVELFDIEMFIKSKRTDEQNNIECRTRDVIWLDTINELNDTLNNEINILTVERL